MEETTEYTLDTSTLDSISSETRVLILKSLHNRQKTNAELARELSLTPPTIRHHIERLKETGLVESHEDGRKWVYYHLTPFGEALIRPDKKWKFSVVLSALLTCLTGLAAVVTYLTLPRLAARPLFPSLIDPFFLMFVVAAVALVVQLLVLAYVFLGGSTYPNEKPE
ncbi:MAG: winged helix-turn-helix domain-containing protein [Methanoregula sp.]|jgi:DNA-binding transcriptional ArsR family regulator